MNPEQEIIDSWQDNAAPWIDAIALEKIASRVRVTNHAIIAAVNSVNPNTVLDIGCGEGWLVRALTAEGMDVLGIDVIPTLITSAKAQGRGRYSIISYEQLANGGLQEKFDALVCNFSLLGKESVESVVKSAASLLHSDGSLVIQTLHPLYSNNSSGTGVADYQDGWRKSSWQGCGEGFTNPAPWYFRTLESWAQLFQRNGLRLVETREPTDPDSGNIVSIIFIVAVEK